MKTCSLLFFLLLAFFVSNASAQNNQKSISQLPMSNIQHQPRENRFQRRRRNRKLCRRKANRSGTNHSGFTDALEIIRNNHVGGKKGRLHELAKGSFDGMLRSLDPHSNYFDQKEYEALLTDQRANISASARPSSITKKSPNRDLCDFNFFPIHRQIEAISDSAIKS
jgi:C-terminal processing protease CtpA/Prc